jgi:hypothetical protein
MEETQENIEKSVLAAFDSVELITELTEQESLDSEETDRLDRNVAHLRIMMSKEWFVNALTSEQRSAIEAFL